jgi:hypothetical protein
LAVEVDDGGGGEKRVEPAGVAEFEHDACDPGALDRRVELVGDLGDELVAGVDVVVGGGIEEALDLGAADLWERDAQP